MKKENRMKKTLLAALTVAALSIGTQAQAISFWEGGVLGYDGTNDYYINNVTGLDWSSSGSGMAVGVKPATPLYQGQQFTFLYQASLIGFTDKNGQAISDAHLNAKKYEYTVVAQIPEIVSSVTNNPVGPGTQTGYFQTLAGGSWTIFRDTTPNSVVSTGFGFDDGEIAAQGTFTPGGYSTFTATTPGVQGSGSTILEGIVNLTTLSIASSLDFFNPPQGTQNGMINGIRIEGTLNQPALDSLVAIGGKYFDGRDDGVFASVLVDNNNQQFKVDGSSKFTPVPEPSTMLLLGLGLFGIAGYSKRKMKK